jgi:hypothetical protein
MEETIIVERRLIANCAFPVSTFLYNAGFLPLTIRHTFRAFASARFLALSCERDLLLARISYLSAVEAFG